MNCLKNLYPVIIYIMAKRCPTGFTLKKGYFRKSRSASAQKYIESTCIVRRGRAIKTGVKIKLEEPGLLRSYGYNLHESSADRKRALLSAMKHEDPLKVLRHLIVLRTYRKYERNLEPQEATYYGELDNDVKWLQNVYRSMGRKSKSVGGRVSRRSRSARRNLRSKSRSAKRRLRTVGRNLRSRSRSARRSLRNARRSLRRLRRSRK